MGSSLMESIKNNCESHVNELSVIWDYIGFEQSDRHERIIEISDQIKQVLLNRIENDNKFRLEIESEIESKKRDIAQLCQLLKINTYFPPRDLSSFSLLKVLKDKLNELENERNSRQEKYLSSYKDLFHYCKLMSRNIEDLVDSKVRSNFDGDDVSNFNVKKDFIPMENDVIELSNQLIQLKEKYKELLNRFFVLLKDVGRIASDIEYTGETDFEKEILSKLPTEIENSANVTNNYEMDESVLDRMGNLRLKLVKRKAMLVSTCEELRSYLLSMWFRLGIDQETNESFMESHVGYKPEILEALQEEVSKCQQMKWEQITVYYSGLLEEKEDLQRKLLMSNSTSQLELECSPQLSEEQISKLEHEIERMKEQYEHNKLLYDTVAQYQRLWLQYLDVEAQMKDPAILSNRGGILLKTEKERKRLLKELPKTESAVSQAIEEYEKSSQIKFLVWNSLTFKEYVEYLRTEFKSRKESGKYKRPNSSASQSVASSPRRVSSATRVK